MRTLCYQSLYCFVYLGFISIFRIVHKRALHALGVVFSDIGAATRIICIYNTRELKVTRMLELSYCISILIHILTLFIDRIKESHFVFYWHTKLLLSLDSLLCLTRKLGHEFGDSELNILKSFYVQKPCQLCTLL